MPTKEELIAKANLIVTAVTNNNYKPGMNTNLDVLLQSIVDYLDQDAIKA